MTNSSQLQQTANSPDEQALEKTTQQVLQVALKQQQDGQTKAAGDLYRAILAIQPNQPDANHNLGLLAVEAQQPTAALPFLEAALNARPEQPQYWLSYIEALIQAGQMTMALQVIEVGRQHGLESEAVARFAGRLALHPQTIQEPVVADQPESSPPTVRANKQGDAETTRSGLSVVKKKSHKDKKTGPNAKEIRTVAALYGQGRNAELEPLARSLSMRFPQHGFGWKVLGLVLQAQGQLNEAVLCMQKAVKLLPTDAEALNNLGGTLGNLGRLAEAEVNLGKALALKPYYAEALCTLGTTLRSQGRLLESEAKLKQAISLKPDLAEAHNNLGLLLDIQGRVPEAIRAYQRAVEIQPGFASAHSNLLFSLSHDVEVEPMHLLSAHLAFGEQFEAPLRASWQLHTNTKNPARCLQVGFVSGDLFSHAVASFLEPALVFLAKQENLSLHAYYNNTIEDSVTQRLRTYFSHWYAVPLLNDTQLADKIRADRIDILIDLSGHTGHNRLLTFARKPAPIQASWIGYPGTTGLQAMDYYICDKFFVPPGESDWQFTEKMVYLPTSSVFQPDGSAPEVNRLAALDNGYITYGSFNRDNKINDAVIMLFAMVLQRTPSARLIMAGINPKKQPDFAERFAMAGINADRLTFYPRTNMHDYLKLHHLVDVCLDTFPYGGGTTTFHAAYMGVPTVTLAGETPASRSGASILGRLGLDDFVATSIEDFVEISANMSAKVNELALTRESLRARFNASGIGQPELLSKHIEMALRTAWERWCSGTPAKTITITP